jgi:hypothetical protein
MTLVSKNENIGLAATRGLQHTNFEPLGPETILDQPIMKQMLPKMTI